jgi:hypothetical protein
MRRCCIIVLSRLCFGLGRSLKKKSPAEAGLSPGAHMRLTLSCALRTAVLRRFVLLAPYPADDIICWPVSARVDNVGNNDSRLIEPVAAA